MFNRLDDETKCRTDSIDVFTQYAFDNCRLAGVVKSSDGTCQPRSDNMAGPATHSIKMRISLSFRRAFLNIDNIVDLQSGEMMLLRETTDVVHVGCLVT